MDKNFKYLDLIDKHFSGNLKGSEAISFQDLYKNDSDFKKEVEFYKYIYKTIEINEEEKLKKRLNVYHEDYLSENPKKTKNIYKRLFIVSSVAAAIFLGLFLFDKNTTNQNQITFPNNSEFPVVVGNDSLTIEEKIKEKSIEHKEVIVQEDKVIKDESKNLEYDTQLSFGGLKELPTNCVRRINYPINLQYIFDGKEILLIGNTSISGLQLKILKDSSGNLLLKYQNQYYKITKSSSRKPLKITSTEVKMNNPTDEEIKIKLKGFDEISTPSKNTKVFLTGKNNVGLAYFFEKKEGKLLLTIDGKLPLKETKFYEIRNGKDSLYFLKINKYIYQLNTKATKYTALIETNILANKFTQLFREDRELLKTVYSTQ